MMPYHFHGRIDTEIHDLPDVHRIGWQDQNRSTAPCGRCQTHVKSLYGFTAPSVRLVLCHCTESVRRASVPCKNNIQTHSKQRIKITYAMARRLHFRENRALVLL